MLTPKRTANKNPTRTATCLSRGTAIPAFDNTVSVHKIFQPPAPGALPRLSAARLAHKWGSTTSQLFLSFTNILFSKPNQVQPYIGNNCVCRSKADPVDNFNLKS